mmetsp:Transcript_31728/g.60573  ORF Transcript_31728/g.60573 Transcript_31728/m.60573 type:complete len:1010 (+) Transcript_31728:607-3636(+)
MTVEHFTRLEEVGFAWTTRDLEAKKKWKARFSHLEEYNREHDNCDIAQKHSPLNNWCRAQRKKYKEGDLSEEQINQLEGLGFKWAIADQESLDKLWDNKFSELIAFNEQNGHCNVKITSSKLGNWVDVQRTKKTRGKLAAGRIERLNEIGFTWGKPRKFPQENVGWEHRFCQLQTFAQDHGHCQVPKGKNETCDVRKLATWVHDQRNVSKRGKLSEERIRRLDEIGFSWSTRQPPNQLSWEERFAHLEAYRQEHGDFNVKGVTGLGGWVQTQRKYRRKGVLSEDRISALDKLEFDWGAPSRRQSSTEECEETEHEAGGGPETNAQGLRVENEDIEHGKAGASVVELQDHIVGEESSSLREIDISSSNCMNLNITVPPGRLGLTIQFNDCTGGLVTAIHPTSAMGNRVSVGDQLVTIDGRHVMEEGDLSKGNDKQRDFGFATENDVADKEPASEEERDNQHKSLEEAGFAWASARLADQIGPDQSPVQLTLSPENVARWEEMYAQLRQFGAENGHFTAPLSSHYQLRTWIDEQRHNFKQNTLPDARIARLEAIGFDLVEMFDLVEGQTEVAFDDRIAQLKQYSRLFGNCDVPISHPVLGSWVWHQRNNYKQLTISDECVKSLETSGFEWQLSFDDRLLQLQQYTQTHGNCNPPQNHVVLGEWVKSQRKAHRKKELSEEHTASLVGIGFSWGTAPLKLGWENRYEMLQQYKLQFGDCNPPRAHPQLGYWVGNQRSLYKRGNLSQERIAALNKLGFNWGMAKKNPDVSWREQYNELLSYKAEHGNCNVRQSDTGLGRFVHWQRYVYKKGKISEERVNLLNEIGFNFDWGYSAEPTVSWDTRFAQLQRYKEEHGDCNIPRNHADLAGLRRWVHNQRSRFETIPDAQRTRLMEIGVTPIGNLRKEHWEEHYTQLLTHKEEHDCNATRGMSVELGKWVANQRRYHKRGTLSDERTELLRNIGFEFESRGALGNTKGEHDRTNSGQDTTKRPGRDSTEEPDQNNGLKPDQDTAEIS